MPGIVLSPHFDDAVLSCWSVLTVRPAPTVVNVFASIPDEHAPLSPWDRLTRARDARERALARVEEDAHVLSTLDIEPINLDFEDSVYREGEQDTGPIVLALLDRLRPGARVYAPAGIGGHPDHFAVRAAAVSLLRRGFDVTLYGELPYAMHYGWPHWVTGAEPDPYLDVTVDWQSRLSYGEVDLRAEDATVVRLDRKAMEAKLRAVRTYRTQYSGMRKLFSDEDSLAYEVYWPLSQPSLTRAQKLRYEILWRAGARRGSKIERLMQGRVLRRIRPSAGSRMGQLLRQRGSQGTGRPDSDGVPRPGPPPDRQARPRNTSGRK